MQQPWILLLAACSSGGDPQTGPDTQVLDQGWIAELSTDPGQFQELMSQSNRDGWIAFHRADWSTAAAKLSGAGRARALEEQAKLEADLARLSALAWQLTFSTWDQRVGFPENSLAPVMAGLAAANAGSSPEARAWLERTEAIADPGAHRLAQTLLLHGFGTPVEAASERITRCYNAHLQARTEHSLGPLSICGDGLLLRQTTGSTTHDWYDPLQAMTRSLVHEAQGRTAREALTNTPAPSASLPGLLFGGHWTTDDAAAALRGDVAPTLSALGVVSQDDPGKTPPARERIQRLDTALDGWSQKVASTASPEGLELLGNLKLVGVYRSRVLVDWARKALDHDSPQEALIYTRAALDVEQARKIGPLNPPGLFAVMAEANLRAGYARQALDNLQVLVETHDWTRGLDEIVGDLVILKGIGRSGDSKEH